MYWKKRQTGIGVGVRWKIFTKNTPEKLMKIEHFNNITYLDLCWFSETFHENKHIQVILRYSSTVSNRYKELIQKYSNLLKKEDGCVSQIGGYRLDYFNIGEIFGNPHFSSSPEDGSSDTSFVSFDRDENVSNFDGNEDFLFPWKDEKVWELPWDTEE